MAKAFSRKMSEWASEWTRRIRRQARVRVGIRGEAWRVGLGSRRERAGLPELLDSTRRCEMGRTVGTCLNAASKSVQAADRMCAIRGGVGAGVCFVGCGDGDWPEMGSCRRAADRDGRGDCLMPFLSPPGPACPGVSRLLLMKLLPSSMQLRTARFDNYSVVSSWWR